MLTQREYLKNLHYIKKRINKHFCPPRVKVQENSTKGWNSLLYSQHLPNWGDFFNPP